MQLPLGLGVVYSPCFRKNNNNYCHASSHQCETCILVPFVRSAARRIRLAPRSANQQPATHPQRLFSYNNFTLLNTNIECNVFPPPTSSPALDAALIGLWRYSSATVTPVEARPLLHEPPQHGLVQYLSPISLRRYALLTGAVPWRFNPARMTCQAPR